MREFWARPVVRAIAVALGVLVFAIFIYAARAALFPFIVAFAIAYVLDPLVDRMEKAGMSRIFAIVAILIALLASVTTVAALVAPMIGAQVEAMAANVPRYVETVKGLIVPWLESLTDVDKARMDQAVREGMMALGDLPVKAVKAVSSAVWAGLSNVMDVALALFNLVIIPVAAFYLLKDFNDITEKLGQRVPPARREALFGFMGKIDMALSGFVKGQLTVASIMAVVYSTGLFLIGAPMGIAIGLAAGAANIVPYLPIAVGFIPALALTYLQYPGFERVLMVVALFAAGLALEGMVITPRTLEKSVGLHPVAVMASLFIGAAFFGFIGILLAVPAAAVIKVALMELDDAYLKSEFFTGNGGEGK
ncbi:MAG: AI-2E family transporter [Nitrospinae bacterium]|nr:AI-2E family transporter [Nitrospinota bacterium]